MSLSSDFIISNTNGVPDYDGTNDLPDTDICQFSSITPLETAGLLEALRGEGDRVEMILEFPLLTPEIAEMWTTGVPEDFVLLLADLDDISIQNIAKQFAQITAEELQLSDEDATSIVSDLASLASRAKSQNMKMFHWMSL